MKEILIRKAKVGDEKAIGEISKEGLKRNNFVYTGGNKPWNKKKLLKRRNEIKQKSGFIVFVAIDKENNKIVGSIMGSYKTSGRLRHRVDCGWSVHPDYQGRGIGKKLLKALLIEAKKRGLRRAEAECAIENTASFKLAKSLGFKVEGIKKSGLILDNGRYVDTYILGKDKL